MKLNKSLEKKNLKRGIYLLPNFFTMMNLFFGFYSVICSIGNDFKTAAIAIIIAAVFDSLDGKIARVTNTSSRFGAEFDSLADLISFGMAPGLMMYLWILQPLGRLGWLAAFLFTACGALRLARFNTNLDQPGDEHFVGLPIPGAAGMTAVIVLFAFDFGIDSTIIQFPVLILIYVLSFLMVSSIKYLSVKKVELVKAMSFNVLVSMMLVLILIASKPSITLLILALAYIASGPALFIYKYYHKIEPDIDIPTDEETEDQKIISL